MKTYPHLLVTYTHTHTTHTHTYTHTTTQTNTHTHTTHELSTNAPGIDVEDAALLT